MNGDKYVEDIINFVHWKYNHFDHSVPYDNDEMNDIMYGIEDDLLTICHNDYVITVADAIKAVDNQKQGMADGEEGIMSNIIHEPYSLYALITIF